MRCCTLLLLLAVAAAPQAQRTVPAAFDAVSLKPSSPAGIPPVVAALLQVRGNRVRATGITAAALIALAFPDNDLPRQVERIVGGPGWVATAQFEFIATAPADASETDLRRALPALLRAVLEERFTLKAHVERRPMPVYALIRARPGALGPQLHESQIATRWSSYGSDYVSAYGVTLESLAGSFTGQRLAGRPVIDRTGLTGPFDLELYWVPERTTLTAPPVADAATGPSLFTALQEQLGLKLEPRNEPMEVLVVDHIERPRPN